MVCERCENEAEYRKDCDLCKGSGFVCIECLAPLECDYSHYCDSCAANYLESIADWLEAEDTGN